MTLYAHVTAGTVDQVGQPPAVVLVDGRWYDLRPRDPAVLAVAGWVEAVETPRPADTATDTSDMTWTLTDGKAVQTWTVRPKTPAELQADTEAANEQTIRDKAATALNTNTTFLGIASPTNAQNAAQVKALTRQMNGLIRLTIRRLDGTE